MGDLVSSLTSTVFIAVASVAILPATDATCFEVGGFLATVFTPVDDNAALDVGLVRPYAQFLKDNGVDGVVVASTTGEGPTLNLSDSKILLDAWMEAAPPLNLYVVAAVGNVLPDAQDLASYAQLLGVDAILARPEPYYIPETPEELLYNMQLIADAAPDTPLIYDDNPEYNDVYVDIEKFYDLATEKIPSFRGIKSNVFENTLLLRNKIKGEQKLYAANSFLFAAELFIGVENFMLDLLNLFPKQVIEIAETARGGKNDSLEQSTALYEDLIDLVEAITEQKQDCKKVPVLKEAMPFVTGIDVGPVRPPLIPLTEDEKDALQKRLEAKNITIVDSDT